MTPSSVLLTIASSDESTMAASHARAMSSGVFPIITGQTGSQPKPKADIVPDIRAQGVKNFSHWRPLILSRVMDLGLAGKVVLVTGAGQGLGRAIGLAFAAEHAQDRKSTRLNSSHLV